MCRLAYSAAVTDGVFACVADGWATTWPRMAPVYAYEFNDRDAPAPEPLRTLPFPVGASHSLELRYLFDIGGAPSRWIPRSRELSDQMIDYWSRFVTDGAPDAAGQPDWPALGTDVAGAVDVVAARRQSRRHRLRRQPPVRVLGEPA